MNFELFIAKRFLNKNKKSFSRPIIRIATVSIALGLAVMIVSIAILRGFQGQITEKIVGFGAHIRISNFEASNALDSEPVDLERPFINRIKSVKGVRYVQAYGIKGGMVKTDDQIQGSLLKGLPKEADISFFASNMQEGRLIHHQSETASNEVIISRYLASKLKLKVGDKLKMYFLIDENLRARAFDIVGIYHTGLGSFDEKFIIGDLKQIQKLNNWSSNQAEGIEVGIDNFTEIDKIANEIYDLIDYDLTLTTIKQTEPALFSWLQLLDTNIVVILIIMALVSIVTIFSTLLIMIFERTSMIGLLKTLGSNTASIRKIFLWQATLIITKGILIGNIVAIAVCVVQDKFKLIKLNSESFSLDYVPIDLRIDSILLVSFGTLIVCVLTLLIPTGIIAQIQPAKTLQVE